MLPLLAIMTTPHLWQSVKMKRVHAVDIICFVEWYNHVDLLLKNRLLMIFKQNDLRGLNFSRIELFDVLICYTLIFLDLFLHSFYCISKNLGMRNFERVE